MGETKFQGKYRIEQTRLTDYDYGSNGAYFITVCTKDKMPYFGDTVTVNGESAIKPASIGQRFVDGCLSISEFSPNTELFQELHIYPELQHADRLHIISFTYLSYAD